MDLLFRPDHFVLVVAATGSAIQRANLSFVLWGKKKQAFKYLWKNVHRLLLQLKHVALVHVWQTGVHIFPSQNPFTLTVYDYNLQSARTDGFLTRFSAQNSKQRHDKWETSNRTRGNNVKAAGSSKWSLMEKRWSSNVSVGSATKSTADQGRFLCCFAKN